MGVDFRNHLFASGLSSGWQGGGCDRAAGLVLENQLPHEIVNLFFPITDQNNKLTIFAGEMTF